MNKLHCPVGSKIMINDMLWFKKFWSINFNMRCRSRRCICQNSNHAHILNIEPLKLISSTFSVFSLWSNTEMLLGIESNCHCNGAKRCGKCVMLFYTKSYNTHHIVLGSSTYDTISCCHSFRRTKWCHRNSVQSDSWQKLIGRIWTYHMYLGIICHFVYVRNRIGSLGVETRTIHHTCTKCYDTEILLLCCK